MATNTERKRLPNRFFKANPLMEISAAFLAYCSITVRRDQALEEMIDDLSAQYIAADRKAEIQLERQRMEQTDDPAALVEIMRKQHDILNRRLLCAKIIALHEQTMPLVLRRYRTCTLDHFIDAATEVFAVGEMKYVQMLRDMYADIRYPFAQACACLVFGMQGMEEEIPFLLSEYERFQREYPDETYHQHPLLALYLLHDKL